MSHTRNSFEVKRRKQNTNFFESKIVSRNEELIAVKGVNMKENIKPSNKTQEAQSQSYLPNISQMAHVRSKLKGGKGPYILDSLVP